MIRRFASRILLSMLLVLGSALQLSSQSEHEHRCGTPVIADEIQRILSHDNKERAAAALDTFLARPSLQRSVVSPAGHFRVHWDQTGVNAPPPFDRNSDGIPDFVDSVAHYMDLAWRVQIDECGFRAPPSDIVRSGPENPDNLLDVYLLEQNGQFYGLAYPSGSLTPSTSSGYMVIDNDFAEFSTSGVEGLKVTTAHEFFHLVQFAGYRSLSNQYTIFEGTATWMEYLVHPEIGDYLFYIDTLHGAADEIGMATNNVSDGATGYGHAMYFQLLTQLAGKDVIRRIWEEYGRLNLSFEAINRTLLASEGNENLATTFCRYAEIMYQSGSSGSGADTLPKMSQYRRIQPASIRTLNNDEILRFDGTIPPLGYGVWRVLVPVEAENEPPDTLDFLVVNARSDVGAGGQQWVRNPEPFTLEVSTDSTAGFSEISFRERTLYYRFDVPHEEWCVSPFFNGGSGFVLGTRPSPQPFVNDGANRLIFAVNLDETEVSFVDLRIYSVDMRLVGTAQSEQLETLRNQRGIIFDGVGKDGRPLSSGVYVYTLQVNDFEPVIGKIAIIRQ